MTAWEERPVEEARLLNPALLASLVAASVGDYESTAHEPMPWTLSFLVPALALHERTRAALPGNTSAHFATWLDRHAEIRVGFPGRARAMVPLTKEGLRLGLRSGALAFEGSGLRVNARLGSQRSQSDEVAQCLDAARFVGRWFARRLDIATIFGLLGVRP
jgi:hypothetical protein